MTYGDAWCWAVSTETHRIVRGLPSGASHPERTTGQCSWWAGREVLTGPRNLGPSQGGEKLELGMGRQTRWSVPGPWRSTCRAQAFGE